MGCRGLNFRPSNSAQKPALGAGHQLDAIAAVVIGGTSLSGGEGSIFGTIIGAFIISVLTNGLRIISVPQEWQIVITRGDCDLGRSIWIFCATTKNKYETGTSEGSALTLSYKVMINTQNGVSRIKLNKLQEGE